MNNSYLGSDTVTGFLKRVEILQEEMLVRHQPKSREYLGEAGVFIGRMQTPGGHIAHILNIFQALTECEHVLVLIGSSDKSGEKRNPYTGDLREMILRETLDEEIKLWPNFRNRLTISTLRDLSDESDNSTAWGYYLWANAVSRLPNDINKFRLYYSDNPEIPAQWFTDDFLHSHVDVRQLDRKDIMNGVSGTDIRNAIIKYDEEDRRFLQEYLPFAAIKRMANLRPILLQCNGLT